MSSLSFAKYHALGNTYLVLPDAHNGRRPLPALARLLCDPHFGLGADGILVGGKDGARDGFWLRIFNPDGSEAEKSGNGLRIFARYLYDTGAVAEDPFHVHTLGGPTTCQVLSQGRAVTAAMGRVSFFSADIPMAGPPRQALAEQLSVAGQELTISAATIGNPHCVLIRPVALAAEAKRLGPLIENAPVFPQRTNVQFVQVLDCENLRLEIWERGAGYTLASGSSACAAAAVAHRLGLCAAQVTAHMPGGALAVSLSPDFSAQITGPVVRVAEGFVAAELLAELDHFSHECHELAQH